jgi:hypothetical protein
MEVLDSVNGVDVLNTTWKDTSEIRLAHYIAPYGKTVFSQIQMPDFLADLDKIPDLRYTSEGIESIRTVLEDLDIPVDDSRMDKLKLHGTSREDLETLALVRRLAERCRDEPDLLLVFTGD